MNEGRCACGRVRMYAFLWHVCIHIVQLYEFYVRGAV